MSESCIERVYYYFHADPYRSLQQIAIKIFSLVICTLVHYKVTLKGFPKYPQIWKRTQLITSRPIKWPPKRMWARSALPWHSSINELFWHVNTSIWSLWQLCYETLINVLKIFACQIWTFFEDVYLPSYKMIFL